MPVSQLQWENRKQIQKQCLCLLITFYFFLQLWTSCNFNVSLLLFYVIHLLNRCCEHLVIRGLWGPGLDGGLKYKIIYRGKKWLKKMKGRRQWEGSRLSIYESWGCTARWGLCPSCSFELVWNGPAGSDSVDTAQGAACGGQTAGIYTVVPSPLTGHCL